MKPHGLATLRLLAGRFQFAVAERGFQPYATSSGPSNEAFALRAMSRERLMAELQIVHKTAIFPFFVDLFPDPQNI